MAFEGFRVLACLEQQIAARLYLPLTAFFFAAVPLFSKNVLLFC